MAISDYLRDLRSAVGSRLLLVPSSVALIFDDEGRLLMLRSAERDIWMLPGGAIDPDEHPDEAVIRETREETGLDVEIVGIHSVHGGPEMRVTFVNGDEISYVMTCYECRVTGGAGRPDGDEVAELRYVTEAEAMALPTPPWGRVVLPRAFEPRF